MSLPDKFKRAGVVGTSDAKTMLRDVAVSSLKRRAGYMPRILPGSVYSLQVNDARPVTPGASTSQLYRMLLGDFQFETCLAEWCFLVGKHGMRMPSELIPSMLNSHLIYPDWRDLIMLAMGSYARWIVAHHREEKHWHWVSQTSVPRIEQIESQIDRESWVLAERYETLRDKLDFHRRVAGHRHFWNDTLAELALDYIHFAIHNKPFDHWRYDINRFNQTFAYYAPVQYHASYQTYLNLINHKQATNFDISTITTYRQKLQRIIIDDATIVQAGKQR